MTEGLFASGAPRKITLWAFAAFLLAGLAVVAVAMAYLMRQPPGSPKDPPITLIIAPGAAPADIAAQLEKSALIADRRGFLLLARYRGQDIKLKAGEYRIARGLPLKEVLGILVTGKTVLHRFTVIPGQTAAQVAANLKSEGIDPRNEAAALMNDAAFAASLGVPAKHLEGYLFPETYAYERGEDARALIARMVAQFDKTWKSKLADAAAKQGQSRERTVILASIIEKESGYPPERPLIARVFFNRLAEKMPLQADPTVIYGLGDKFKGDLTREHLAADTPYNTYTRPGLPPGPICNPSLDALEAALSPAEGSWLYFVATGEERHAFSTTYGEHQLKVNRYQRQGAGE